MKNDRLNKAIFIYLVVIGLVYVPTIGLWGNAPALRALHLDIPPSASNAAFQAKALANFLAGVVMLAGGVGLVARQRWGRPITVAGLVCQMAIYAGELAIFAYLPTLGAGLVVTALDAAILYGVIKSQAGDGRPRSRPPVS